MGGGQGLTVSQGLSPGLSTWRCWWGGRAGTQKAPPHKARLRNSSKGHRPHSSCFTWGDLSFRRGGDLLRSLASWRPRWTQAASKMAGRLLPQSGQRQSPPRGSERSYSRLGLTLDGPEEAGPWCPVARQVQPPPSLGPPFRWRGPLQAGPTGLAPGAPRPELAPRLGGGADPSGEGLHSQRTDRLLRLSLPHLPAPGDGGGVGVQKKKKR